MDIRPIDGYSSRWAKVGMGASRLDREQMDYLIHKLGRRYFVVLFGVIALFSASLLLLGATSADAQTPAACEEYEVPPCGDGDGDDDDDGDGDNVGPGSTGGASGDGGGDGDGALPFTGYPLTGLILLFLVLLLLGLTIRAGVALRERLARNPSSA